MTPPAATEPKPAKPPRTRGLFSKKYLPWLIILVLLLVLVFLYVEYRSAQNKLTGDNQTTAALVSELRKIVVLPSNETPTVATVINADKLKSQTFFAHALDGDKVIVYNREKEAILYRPSTNQIVTIAPVTVTPSSRNPAGQ